MNEKNAKLLRYFVKHTKDLQTAANIKIKWPHMNHKQRGRVSSWMKRVIVTVMALDERAKQETIDRNKLVLDGFVNA